VSDLETSAHEAVAKVQPLIEALDEAQRECQEAVRYVHALNERLAQDRQSLADAVDALGQDAEAAEQMLAGQAADATSNLGRVKEGVSGAAHVWEEMLQDEEKALKGASDDLLQGLAGRVDELAGKAEGARHAVLEWAASIGQQLEETVEKLEQVVSVGLPKMLGEWRQGTETEVSRLVEFLDKTCPELLDTREASWRDKIAQAHELMDHAFEGIAKHAQEVASYTPEKWGHLLEAELEPTQSQAHTLAEETLPNLSKDVEGYEGSLQAGAKMVGDQHDQVAKEAAKLEQGLLEVRGRWATFGITG
jgi:hypothetical protein